MNKKSLLGLILFAGLITTGLFLSADYLIGQESKTGTEIDQPISTEDDRTKDELVSASLKDEPTEEEPTADVKEEVTADKETQTADTEEGTLEDNSVVEENIGDNSNGAVNILTEEPWLTANPSDIGAVADGATEIADKDPSKNITEPLTDSDDTFSTSINTAQELQLILDCNEVDYASYIPEMVFDSKLEVALDITNPDIGVDATAAILFDADTKEVLYYKNPVQAVFPASTAKLLSSLVALEMCEEDEKVTIGDEITMIASDSTRAYLKEGQILTIRNILEGMLLPSGNDAAYAIAAYVGRKSLQSPNATKEEAVIEFVRLMNAKAKKLGVKNSCFKTPDGYDAIGQYTTAYDMGLIGVEAAKNKTIIDISGQSSSRNIFPSGEDITWNNTNKLISRYSGQYYSNAIGLKTGTSTMAGRCLIAAAERDGKEVVCAIMDSSSAGRWEDAIALLKYGLE
jgi:D-alanyl-D-alanine carboxypeptidase (penicillin-binding protein 5/6)